MAGLNGAEGVGFALSFQERFVRFSGRRKCTEISLLSVGANFGVPRLVIAALHGASKARSGILSGFPVVLHVLFMSCLTKIGNSIVKAVAIDVVDRFSGPHAMYMEPRKAMGVVNTSAENNHNTATGVPVPCNGAGQLVFGWLNKPCEDSGLQVVRKLLSKLFGGEAKLFHLAPFISGSSITGRHQPEGNESSFRPLKLGWCGVNFNGKVA